MILDCFLEELVKLVEIPKTPTLYALISLEIICFWIFHGGFSWKSLLKVTWARIFHIRFSSKLLRNIHKVWIASYVLEPHIIHFFLIIRLLPDMILDVLTSFLNILLWISELFNSFFLFTCESITLSSWVYHNLSRKTSCFTLDGFNILGILIFYLLHMSGQWIKFVVGIIVHLIHLWLSSLLTL